VKGDLWIGEVDNDDGPGQQATSWQGQIRTLAWDDQSNRQHRVEKWETRGVWMGETVEYAPQVTTKHQLQIHLIIHLRWIT